MNPSRLVSRVSASVAGALVLLTAPACVKEISSEERLERETTSVPLEKTAAAAELDKLNCGDAQEQLASARDVNKPETQRIADYTSVYTELRTKTRAFEEAMSRNPDLQYQEGAQKYAAARDLCIQQTADVRVEFERYVREIVDVPTVQELKGGNTVTVARMDFETLRQGIEALDPEDKEQLLTRVDNTEDKLESGAAKTPRKRRK